MSAVPPVSWEQIGLDPATLELFEFTPYGPSEVMDSLAAMWGLDPEGILLASSASHAHFCFAAALAGPGGTVVHEVPGYLPVVDALSVVGARTVPFERRFEDQYRIDVDRLAQIIEQHGANLLLITNLHNPSGVQLSREEEQGIVSICDRLDCHVLVDEMYRPFLDPDPGPLSRLHPSIVSIGGLNKVHGISQVRFGWGFGGPDLVDRARCVFDSTTLHNSCLTDQVARAAMGRWEPLRQRGCKFASDGWDLFSDWLEKHPLSLVAPAGGLVCFPRVPSGYGSDAVEFRRRCLEHDVNLTPGHFFGAPDHVRIGFGLPVDQLEPALEALGRVLTA
ncbi:MAG: pyridoxal phosphate-dependent aminotransferase [Planctomycetota bacterium]|nr:pyridoxal phosphate-dependent aminotransferase [Planctomycetota bacterium]